MKKRIAGGCLTLALMLLLTGTAFAAGTEVAAGDIETAKGVKTVTANLSADGKYINLTVDGLTGGQQYLVLMVSGTVADAGQAQITQSTIRYIDQAQADNNGSVSFQVYPSSMQSGTILLSGSDLPLSVAAAVKTPSYKIGDVNGDNVIDLRDATVLSRYLAGWNGYKEQITSDVAADINRDNAINLLDSTILSRYLAGWSGYKSYFEES